MLGTDDRSDTLKIGTGEKWQVTRAETRTGRDYELGGQQVEILLTVVGDSDAFVERYPNAAQTYLGRTCTLNTTTYRVANIEAGEAFTLIELAGEEEAA